MFDNYLIRADSLRNDFVDGEVVGFSLAVRNANYRGVFLSLHTGYYLCVDGVEYPREAQTFEINGKRTTAYCVLTPDSIALGDMPEMDRLQRLHEHMITNFNAGDYDQAKTSLDYLKGKWGGELDSFYTIIEQKMDGVFA